MPPTVHDRACTPRPGLERLEERWVPSAVRELPGFEATTLRKGDDTATGPAVPLGFKIDFAGKQFDSLYVNNNGHVTFGQRFGGLGTFSLSYFQRPIIAPFFSDVDTTAAGRVHFGRDVVEEDFNGDGVVERYKAFGVTWDGVGYNKAKSDLTNTFQVVLIDRSDVAPGAFDIEFNYESIGWDIAESRPDSALVGFSTGGAGPRETFLLPGSGQPGAFLDEGPNSLAGFDDGDPRTPDGRFTFDVRPNAKPVIDPVGTVTLPEGQSLRFQVPAHDPDAGQTLTYTLLAGPPGATIDPTTGLLTWAPAAVHALGDYTFRVQVTDSALLGSSAQGEFTVSRVNVSPTVSLIEPPASFHPAGEEFVLSGRFDDPGQGGWSATVVYDRGDPQPVVLNADGSFTVRHTFDAQGVHAVTVAVTDAYGGVGAQTFKVHVLPPGSRGLIELSLSDTADPGETITGELTSLLSGAKLELAFTHTADAPGPASLFAAIYTSPPLETARVGLFFDLQGEGLVKGDTFTITLHGDLLKVKGFQFGYFDTASGKWVDLLHSANLAVVGLDATKGVMTVTFLVKGIFQGTVFTVSLPSAGGETTGPVRPPTAGNGDGPGLSRSVTFASNGQLSLVLTASRDTQLSVSGTSQGSQAASAAANGVANSGALKAAPLSATSGVGGNEEAGRTDDDSGFWRWLQSEEGLLHLLLEGVDPALLLPRKGAAEQVEVEAPAPAAPRAAPAVAPPPAAKPVVDDEEGVEAAALEAPEEYGEFTAALLAVSPYLLGDRRGRKRRRKPL
ncbi:MAG: putative Ig domain-containing protein [Gemmataceae bacterium]